MATVTHSVVIEPMAEADIHEVSIIEHLCYSVPWHKSAYETELHNRSAYYVVARENRAVVGYGGMWVVMDECHLTTLAVLPDMRRRGIGRQLLSTLLRESIRRGACRATLEVREMNTSAQRLYHAYGFREQAVRRSYYTDNQENALVMWAEDIHSPEYSQLLHALLLPVYSE